MVARITSLEPSEFADSVCREVRSRGEWLWRLATGDEGLRDRLALGVARDSELWRKAVAVATYAQRGVPSREFGDAELPDPEESLTTVVTVLYVPIGSKHQIEDFDDAVSGLGGGTKRMAIPLDDPVNAILAAAVARLQIECNQSVNPTQLALLASVSEDTVRADIQHERLEARGRRPRLVPAQAAREWLAARGDSSFWISHKVVALGDGDGWVGLVFSPWHDEWGRMTEVHSSARRARNALRRAMAPDASGAVYAWVDDPDGLGWRVPCLRRQIGDDEIVLT